MTMDEQDNETSLIIAGSPEELKTAITQILATAQLIKSLAVEQYDQREYYPERANKPKVLLYFRQDPRELVNTPEVQALRGEISFRLMNKSSSTIAQKDLEDLALLIKSKFAKPPFKWKKGKAMLTYADWDKGVQLNILCPNKSEGKRVVEQVLDLIHESPDWTKANFVENLQPSSRYPKKRQHVFILGKPVELPQRRREATVIFQYAEIYVPGLYKPVQLVDRTKKRLGALQKVY